jgi:hypothetical protein
MELTPEEIRTVLSLIRTIEATNEYLTPEVAALKEKIRFEFGI